MAAQELQATSSFLSSFLPVPNSPSSKAFTAALTARLTKRYAQHWHTHDPERGSAFRALVRLGASPYQIDQSLILAAEDAGIGARELSTALLSIPSATSHHLGERWTLWVDPGCVCVRIDRGELAGRDGVVFEIWGRLPASLSKAHGTIGLDIPRSLSLNNSHHPTLDLLISPTKRSKAILITAPPFKPLSTMGQLLLASPLPLRQPALCSSPFVTPPTPLRPSSAAFTAGHADVFSTGDAQTSSFSELSLHTIQRAPSSGLGAPSSHARRPSSRASSCDEGSGSDGDLGAVSDGGSSIFSAESISSSVTSLGGLMGRSYGGRHVRSCSAGSGSEIRMDGEFKYPPVPARSPSYGTNTAFAFPPHAHSRSNSFSSNHGSTFAPSSPTKSAFNISHSLPASPSKPRRRGTRGAGSSHHESSSSISSISSITSVPQPTNPANPRTRAQALAGTLTEHSGGKVVVLGGGVLLGLAGAPRQGNARGELIGEAKRRERRGRGRSGGPISTWERQL